MRLLFLVLLSACKSDKSPDDGAVGETDADDTDGAPPIDGAISAAIRSSEHIPNVQRVTFTAPVAGESFVAYGIDDAPLTTETPRSAEAELDLAVMGLKSGRTYTWKAVTLGADGSRWESAPATVDIAPAPPELLATVTARDDTRMDPGGYVMTMARETGETSQTVIYDRDGDVVWWYPAISDSRDAHTAVLSNDRQYVVYGFYDQSQDDALGGNYAVPIGGDGPIVFTATKLAHHHARERADGSWLYLGLEYYPVGIEVDGVPTPIVGDQLFEQENGSTDASTSKRVWSYVLDSGVPFFLNCPHMTEDFLDTDFKQWTHVNSLMLDPVEPDRYAWLLARWQDALIKVDLETKELVTQIGGIYATIPSTGTPWSHPHMSQLWDGGFVVFNNNTHFEGPSSAQEWAFDEAGATLVHEWVGVEETAGMGDAKKLANGNVLVAFTAEKAIEERTTDDGMAWRLALSANGGRVELIDDLYTPDTRHWAP